MGSQIVGKKEMRVGGIVGVLNNDYVSLVETIPFVTWKEE
jgi:hypothetical protein